MELSDIRHTNKVVSRDELLALSIEQLADAVLILRHDLKESDARVAEFERICDASREVLHTELYDVSHRPDLLSMCCCARELLADKRRDDVKEF